MLSLQEKLLIKISSIFFFAGSLGGIFLQIYFFRTGGFSLVVVYNIIHFLFLLIFYLASGWFLRKTGSSILIRISLFIFSISWLAVVILKQNSYLLAAVLFGVGNGLYWSGYNLSQYLLSQKGKRENYFGKNISFSNFAVALGPGIGGLIILLGNKIYRFPDFGYYLLFFIIFLLNFYIAFLSSSLPSFRGIKFNLGHIINHKRSYNFKLVLGQHFILGLMDVAFDTLMAIMLFVIIGSESALGGVKTVFTLIIAVVGYFAGGFMVKNKKFYLFTILLASIGIFSLGFWPNWWGVMLMGILTGIGFPFFSIALSTAYFDTIDEHQQSWQEKYHLFLERDGVLGSARVISYLILYFLFVKGNKLTIATNWLMAISVLPLIIGWLLSLRRPQRSGMRKQSADLFPSP